MFVAVAATTTGALCGLWWLAALGVTAHIVGICIVLGDLVACSVHRPPRDFPGFTMGAAICWMLVWLAWLAWKLASNGTRLLADDIFTLSVPVIVGFLLQLLIGAMSYLMPMVMGGGPKIVRATNAKMHAYGALRATITNAGLLLWVLAMGTWTRRIGMVLTVVGLATFLPATAAMVRTGVPMLKEKGRQMAARKAASEIGEAPDPDNGPAQAAPVASLDRSATSKPAEPAPTAPKSPLLRRGFRRSGHCPDGGRGRSPSRPDHTHRRHQWFGSGRRARRPHRSHHDSQHHCQGDEIPPQHHHRSSW